MKEIPDELIDAAVTINSPMKFGDTLKNIRDGFYDRILA